MLMLTGSAYALPSSRDTSLYAPSFQSNVAFIGNTVRASYYGIRDGFAGRFTASGQRFNPNGLTAAHRTLPFGTRVQVSYKGRSVVVVINDRGPAAFTGRSLDLSYGAARELGLVPAGTGVVQMRVLG